MPDNERDNSRMYAGEVEVARLRVKVDSLEREVHDTKSVSLAVFDAYTKLRENIESNLEGRILRVEDSQTWAFRMIVAAFLGLVGEAIVVAIKIGAHP